MSRFISTALVLACFSLLTTSEAAAERPSINALNAAVNQLEAEVGQLQAENQVQQAKIDELQAELDDIASDDLFSAVSVDGATVSVFRIDRITGDRSVVSGRTDSGTVVGAGPIIPLFSGQVAGLAFGDGVVWVSANARYYVVDVDTGDRELISGCTDFSPPGGICPPAELIGDGPEPDKSWSLGP